MFKEQGLDLSLDPIFPVDKALEMMRDGGINHAMAWAEPGLSPRIADQSSRG